MSNKKIVYLTRLKYWERQNSGGLVISKRNYQMIVDIYGEENVIGLYIGTDNNLIKYDSNLIILSEKSGYLKKYYNYLMNRFGYSKDIESRIIDYIDNNQVDCLFFDGSWLGGVIKKINGNAIKKTIVFYHNVEANVQYKEAFIIGLKLWRTIKYLCVKANESAITKAANYRICLNRRDADELYKKYNKKADLLLPTTLIDKYEENERCSKENIEAEKPILLMVGIFFPPNINGLKWLIENVMPKIDCVLWVVGKDMEKFRVDSFIENVKIIGSVDCLNEYYYMADAVVEPIFIGDGMKTKTAEALMFGKAIFATDEALEGYDVENSNYVYRCNSARDFIESIGRHFSNTTSKYYEENRNIYLEKYSYQSEFECFKQYMKERV